MTYTTHYHSPLGDILLAADEQGLTGLWFIGQKYFASTLDAEPQEQDTPILCRANQWLDLYFSGKQPDFLPKLHLIGTPFRQAVWNALLRIPYGQTVTYGDLAQQLHCASAQAVGGAVGHNPLSVIVPCHRVIGHDGSLTGYAGGTEKKRYWLTLEKGDII